MTPLAIVPLIVAAWLIAAVLWGGETLLQMRRQAEWDEHCDDAEQLTTCTDPCCDACPDMPVDFDAMFLDEHGIAL